MIGVEYTKEGDNTYQIYDIKNKVREVECFNKINIIQTIVDKGILDKHIYDFNGVRKLILKHGNILIFENGFHAILKIDSDIKINADKLKYVIIDETCYVAPQILDILRPLYRKERLVNFLKEIQND